MNEALTEAWLQELWPTCREVSREERAVERARHAVDTPSNTRANPALTCENGGTTKDGPARQRQLSGAPGLTPELHSEAST